MRLRLLIVAPVILAVGILGASCGQPQSPTPASTSSPTSGGTASPTPQGTITVFAAASLTEAFTLIGKDFEAKNVGTTVTFNFGSSATLATQIVQGAPADVFASANKTTMAKVTDAGAGSDAVPFASNTLEIAVPPGNPGKVTGLADFADAHKRIAICAAQVPCGSAAVKVFAQAGVTPKPDTLEQDVKAALQKVELDEVDAALVYHSDVVAAGGKVTGIPFPEAGSAVNSYPICRLRASANPATAQAFEDFVRASDGQAVLKRLGFAAP